jgi:hypothetical protein
MIGADLGPRDRLGSLDGSLFADWRVVSTHPSHPARAISSSASWKVIGQRKGSFALRVFLEEA